jgi:hypothetical protein
MESTNWSASSRSVPGSCTEGLAGVRTGHHSTSYCPRLTWALLTPNSPPSTTMCSVLALTIGSFIVDSNPTLVNRSIRPGSGMTRYPGSRPRVFAELSGRLARPPNQAARHGPGTGRRRALDAGVGLQDAQTRRALHDLGADWHSRRSNEAHTRRLIAQLERLGHTVTQPRVLTGS